jgi:hypothetical protein
MVDPAVRVKEVEPWVTVRKIGEGEEEREEKEVAFWERETEVASLVV